MSLVKEQSQTTSLVKKTLEEIGFALPERKRIKATKTTSVRMEPHGTIRVTHAIDTFVDVDNGVMKWKNNLSGKKLVLFFAKESNYLSREFLTPKMSVIYQNIIAERDDIEFLFVGLMEGQTKVEYNRFAKKMPWPSVPHENIAARKLLIDTYYTKLKKKYDAAGIVVLAEDHVKVLCRDAERKLSETHDDTGKNFPWERTAAENAAASAAVLCLCTIS